MEYAIIELKGHQYQLGLGDQVTVNGQLKEVGDEYTDAKAVLVKDKSVELGQPYLKDTVTFKVLEHALSDKLTVATFRAKSRYRKKIGHRQMQTLLQLVKVGKHTHAQKQTRTKSSKKAQTSKKPTKDTKKEKKVAKKSSKSSKSTKKASK